MARSPSEIDERERGSKKRSQSPQSWSYQAFCLSEELFSHPIWTTLITDLCLITRPLEIRRELLPNDDVPCGTTGGLGGGWVGFRVPF